MLTSPDQNTEESKTLRVQTIQPVVPALFYQFNVIMPPV